MTEHSPDVIRVVLDTYKKTRNSPFKTSDQTGISVAEVFEIVGKYKDIGLSATERYGGFGRPEMSRYLVSRRRAQDRGWDNTDPDIVEARARYEAGTHTMATGRDGNWLLLYSIPLRRKATPQPGYFSECSI